MKTIQQHICTYASISFILRKRVKYYLVDNVPNTMAVSWGGEEEGGTIARLMLMEDSEVCDITPELIALCL
jgi:hypothetical protein